MKEQLIIDGVEVDLKPGERITLNFKSNFMGDVSKIESSNSLTINLPKTPRNNALFSYAGNPASGSTFPYRRWPAKYYRDGVEVISVGYCVLVEVGESYNVALYWGTMANFQAWLDADTTLRQLDYSVVSNSSYTWGEEQLSDAGSTDGVIIANYDTGVGSFDDLPSSVGFNPTVRVSSLLERIESQNGLRFNFALDSGDMAGGISILDRLGVPLVTSKGMVADYPVLSSLAIFSRVENYSGRWSGWYGFTFSTSASDYFSTDVGQLIVDGVSMEAKRILPIKAGVVSVRPVLTIRTEGTSSLNGDIPRLHFYVVAMQANGTYYRHRELPATLSPEGAYLRWDFETEDFFYFDLPEGGSFGFLAVTEFAKISSISGSVEARLPEVVEVDINVGDTYQVQYNLPDIKQVDFVKAISQMLGLYALQTINPTNTVAFVSIDSLIRKKSNANDWSDKLVKGQRDGIPESVSFKLDGWARENYFRYKEDDTVLNQGEGVLTIPNENLDASADALTLPFAASDWSVVPIYERNNEGAVERKEIAPRIMQIVATEDGKAALTFTGLGWPALLNKYYGGQGRMLERVVVIKVKVRLSAVDLKNLSFARPVYLSQYGRFYAIRSVSTSSSNECSAELIQLPLD